MKCFHPVGAATWLVIYAMDPEDNDYLHSAWPIWVWGSRNSGASSLSELREFPRPARPRHRARSLLYRPLPHFRICQAPPAWPSASSRPARSSRTRPQRTRRLERRTPPARRPTQPAIRTADAVREVAATGTAARAAIGTGARYPYDLPADHDRHREAVLIVDPGACNPSGVALSLFNACRQVIAEGGNQRTDPAVRLIVTHLSYLTNSHADLDHDKYRALIEACKAKAGASAP